MPTSFQQSYSGKVDGISNNCYNQLDIFFDSVQQQLFEKFVMMPLSKLSSFILLSCFFKTSLLEECPANSEANQEWDEKKHSIIDNIAACECCIAVSHVLHSTFESAHKKLPDTVKKLSYADIIDVTGKKSMHFKNRIYMFLKIEN